MSICLLHPKINIVRFYEMKQGFNAKFCDLTIIVFRAS